MMRCRWSHILSLTVCAATPLAAQEFTTLKGHGGPVMDVAVSADGRVATASFDNSVGLWTGRKPVWLEGHAAAVTSIAFGNDGLVSGGDDFAVLAWAEGTADHLGQHKGKVSDIAISPDGGVAASASWDGTVGLWPLQGQAPGRVLDPGKGGLNALAFHPEAQLLFVASTTGEVFAQPLDGTSPLPLVKHGFGVNVMAMDPAGQWLAYGAVDGVTRVIDPSTGAQIADFSLDRRPILSMAYHAATRQLAVGDGHGFIMVIDTGTWRIARDFRATRRGPIWALAFGPEGQLIYAGGLDDVAYAWPVALLDSFDPVAGAARSFQRAAGQMPNGERQFMRKCSICHALGPGASRKAGPTLHGLFGRRAGTVPGYRYSQVLDGSGIVWGDDTIDQLFDLGPDHFIPGSKMPMQRITARQDRMDLIEYLKQATN